MPPQAPPEPLVLGQIGRDLVLGVLVAGLTHALSGGRSLGEAARFAVAAATATVRHPGGRPDLRPDELRDIAQDL